MITILVHYNNVLINKIYCDKYMDDGALKTLRLSRDNELITSFPLRRIDKFELINSKYKEYYLNIVGVD